jgi:hypothetical protein
MNDRVYKSIVLIAVFLAFIASFQRQKQTSQESNVQERNAGSVANLASAALSKTGLPQSF